MDISFFCEKKAHSSERISIQHLDINIPGFHFDRFIPWIEINQADADHYAFIIHLRSGNRKYHFNLSHHLKLEELETIQAYCRQYLPSKS